MKFIKAKMIPTAKKKLLNNSKGPVYKKGSMLNANVPSSRTSEYMMQN